MTERKDILDRIMDWRVFKPLQPFYQRHKEVLLYLLFGGLTTITEWKQIHAKPAAKIKAIFTFPLFMLTYVPIALVAVFSKVEWKPIKHNVVVNAAEITSRG